MKKRYEDLDEWEKGLLPGPNESNVYINSFGETPKEAHERYTREMLRRVEKAILLRVCNLVDMTLKK